MKTLAAKDIHASPGLQRAIGEMIRRIDAGLPELAALARKGLVTPAAVAQRADEALGHFVGNVDRVRFNLQEALHLTLHLIATARLDRAPGAGGRHDEA